VGGVGVDCVAHCVRSYRGAMVWKPEA
jgi:hypothetical protein